MRLRSGVDREAVRLPDRRFVQLVDWLHGAPGGAALLAVAVGAGAGLGAIVFRRLIVSFTRIFTGVADYSDAAHHGNPHVAWLGPAFVLFAPVIAGLVYGPMIHRFAREARGHGVPEVMDAVARKGGRIAPQVAVVKSLASALCIGGGGSVGREGPIVQIGSALGSSLGSLLRVPPTRRRILIACGAAGGISATFNAPIAGVTFALEVILASFGAELFAVVVLASVTAAVVGRAAFGDTPFLHLPAFHVISPIEYSAYIVLGVAAAAVGVGFMRVLYAVEDGCDRLWRGPEALRPAVGGLLLGCLLLLVPQLYGVGYPVLEKAVGGRYVVAFLLILLVGKMLATSLTIGIGGSGGVFAPSLFLGAMLGTAFGDGIGALAPHGTVAPAGAYGLVGMAAVFAAAARAPITAVLIVFELTGDDGIILPLMLATVTATALAGMITHETIYTLKLRRRGVDPHEHRRPPLQVLKVGAVATPLPEPIAGADPVAAVLARFEEMDAAALPVVDDSDVLRGVIARRELDARGGADDDGATALDLAVPVTPLRPDDSLAVALERLLATVPGLPVAPTGDTRITGWITERDVLAAYTRHLTGAHGARPADSPAPRPPQTTVAEISPLLDQPVRDVIAADPNAKRE